jgi:hypothetical protein
MSWTEGELRTVMLGQYRRRAKSNSQMIAYSQRQVPAPYDRIVSQLIAEDMYARGHDCHEASRRQNYAREVLDAFGEELNEFKESGLPPASFRSQVLTPILQRQLRGVHDAYTPSIKAGINSKKSELSIQDVTKFYLQVDPTNPALIRSYRRNLLYLPEPRWHLGILFGAPVRPGREATDHFNKVRANHDAIMQSLAVEGHKLGKSNVPLLSHVEVASIFDEGLEAFFEEELGEVVSKAFPIHLHALTL